MSGSALIPSWLIEGVGFYVMTSIVLGGIAINSRRSARRFGDLSIVARVIAFHGALVMAAFAASVVVGIFALSFYLMLTGTWR